MIFWRRILIEGAWIALAVVLQQTAVRWVAFGAIRPDLTLIVLTSIALRNGSVFGLFAGLSLGLLQDVYAYETLGANVLAKCLLGYGLGFFEEKVVKIMPATRVFLLGVAMILHDAVYYLATGLGGNNFWNAMWRHTLPSAVFTLFLGALVFYYATGMRQKDN